MNDNRYSIISTIILLISPILAFPFILYGIYNRQKYAFVLFSFFLGLIAFLTIPFADLFRHTMHYYEYEGLTLSEIFCQSELDFLIPIITSLFVNNGIPYEYFRLFETIIASSLLISIFQYHIGRNNRKYNHKEIFSRFCILILFFEFLATVLGVRYGFAVILYVYGLHFLLDKNKLIHSSLFFILAVLVHLSMAFLIPISLILYKMPITKRRTLLWITIIIVAVPLLFDSLGFLLGKRGDWYFSEGVNTTKGYANSSAIGLMFVMGKRLFLLPVLYYIGKKYVNNSWHKMGLVWFIISISFIGNFNLFGRTLFILQLLLPIIIIFSENFSPFSRKKIQIILCCGLLITLFTMTDRFRGYIYPSRYERLILPVPMILNETYDKTWILNHIDNNTYIYNVR